MPLQVPNLDDRTFAQLVAEAKARIPVHTPEWTNFTDADPGITIVQLFAFLSENLLYRSNRIPEANRRKFLTLLGIPLQPATPGRGLVMFSNDRGPMQPWPVDSNLEVRAGKVPFRTRTGLCILPISAAIYYKQPQRDLDAATQAQYQLLYQTFLNSDLDQLLYYKAAPLDAPKTGKPLPVVDLADSVNGTIDRSLWVALAGPPNVPLDTVRRAIGGQTLSLGVSPAPKCEGKVLEPAQAASPPDPDPGLVFEIAAPDADPTGQFGVGPARYIRLNATYDVNVLEEPGIVQLTLPPYEKLLLWDYEPEDEGTGAFPPLVEDKDLAKRIVTWIRIRLPDAQSQLNSNSTQPRQQARITWVGANAARVIQEVPVTNERLGVATGAPNQVYKVANTPVIVDPAPEATMGEGAFWTPASTFILEVQTDTGWETWQQTDDLFAAGPNDKFYSLDPEAGVVSFGSGLRGMRPALGRTIRATYEWGGGPDGNVAIGAINKSPMLPGGFKVENPLATTGADQGESAADGERNIPRYIKHRDRLVTAGDFRDIVMRTPGVDMGRVETLPLFNPNLFQPNGPPQMAPGTVTILVIPKYDEVRPDAPVPDRLFLEAVCRWVDPRRLVTTEIFVRGPDYQGLWLSVGITSMPGQVRELVSRNVKTALKEFLSPLVGGPPVIGAPTDDPCSDTAADPCPPPRGLGWPLGLEVRTQDLEAVATRVPGVRYVDSIQMGVMAAGGSTLTHVTRVPISGLQLPRLDGISVREGAAEDLDAVLGQPPAGPSNLFPVPVLPKKC